ncbi:MAG TPA: hypothetical protein VLB80_05305 [Candidatus Babeliales bacterium]|nr:hypothetical protein [Candidatus Babeliales bacterium]
MKRLALVGIVVAVMIVGVMIFKHRFNTGIFVDLSMQGSDLIIVNDSSDSISVVYKEGNKDVSRVIQAGEQVMGGKGFIRIFTAKKDGSYELTYAFPRPSGAVHQVMLSQIIGSAKKENLGDAVFTKKGMIGDIKVEYEEARILE